MGVAEELRTLAGAWDEWGLGGTLMGLAERLERQEVVSDEDAEAARWVREHGGLGFLEIHLPNLWSFIDHIMYRLGVDKSDIDGPELVDEELDRRLMPPGMEWPRFDDGEKVKFGEVGLDVHGKRRSAEGIKFTQGGFAFVSDGMGDTWWGNDSGAIEDPSVDYSKRVKRPKHDTKPEPPDSWEQLEDDATMPPEAYCAGNGLYNQLNELDDFPAVELFALDLVRRAKALAERERGE